MFFTEQPEHLFGQEPVIESLITQEAIEASQGTAELDFGEAGELTGDGEAGGLRRLAECGDQSGAVCCCESRKGLNRKERTGYLLSGFMALAPVKVVVWRLHFYHRA